jgi:transglutaminase-like putative cysteine protease
LTALSPWAAGSATLATVALVAVVAPTALGASGWGDIPRFTTPNQFDTTSRLNLALDLRNSLTANNPAPKIVYFTTGKRPDAFRVYTLIDFDGTAWSRTPEDESARVPLDGGVQWSHPVNDWGDRQLSRVGVQVLSQAESSLPLPPVPRSVTVGGDWSYSPGLDEVSSDTSSTQDLGYEFEADLDYFSIDGLRALGAASAEDQQLDPRYLALADAIDVDGVRASAREVVDDAATRYDQAMALQEFFRNTQVFTYDTSVTPSGDDSVSTFLEDRSGYCVQFASAMVVMSRTLDIPARLAIGFLPGEQGADGESVITGANAHAWPELYFEGAGWVRFEPTPAVQTGARPAYADPSGANAQNPIDEFPIPGQRPTSAPTAAPEPALTPGADAAGDSSAAPAWWLWVVVAVVIVGVAASWQVLRSRRVAAHRVDDPEHVWAWLRERLPAGLAWPATLTPHESEAYVRGNLLHEEVFLSADADHALSQLVVAVSDHRYAPQGSTQTVKDLMDDARLLADEVSAAKGNDATGRRSRVGAPGAPQHDA